MSTILVSLDWAQMLAAYYPLADGTENAIGWGSLSLINAGLAQGKNRSGLAWFLVSLLLGPIATLLVVVLDPAQAPRQVGGPAELDR